MPACEAAQAAEGAPLPPWHASGRLPRCQLSAAKLAVKLTLVRAGFACTRQELSEDIKQLYQTGLFESVNARVLPQKKGKFKVRRTRCAVFGTGCASRAWAGCGCV